MIFLVVFCLHYTYSKSLHKIFVINCGPTIAYSRTFLEKTLVIIVEDDLLKLTESMRKKYQNKFKIHFECKDLSQRKVLDILVTRICKLINRRFYKLKKLKINDRKAEFLRKSLKFLSMENKEELDGITKTICSTNNILMNKDFPGILNKIVDYIIKIIEKDNMKNLQLIDLNCDYFIYKKYCYISMLDTIKFDEFKQQHSILPYINCNYEEFISNWFVKITNIIMTYKKSYMNEECNFIIKISCKDIILDHLSKIRDQFDKLGIDYNYEIESLIQTYGDFYKYQNKRGITHVNSKVFTRMNSNFVANSYFYFVDLTSLDWVLETNKMGLYLSDKSIGTINEIYTIASNIILDTVAYSQRVVY